MFFSSVFLDTGVFLTKGFPPGLKYEDEGVTVFLPQPRDELLGRDDAHFLLLRGDGVKEVSQTCEQVLLLLLLRLVGQHVLPEGPAEVEGLEHRVTVTCVSKLREKSRVCVCALKTAGNKKKRNDFWGLRPLCLCDCLLRKQNINMLAKRHGKHLSDGRPSSVLIDDTAVVLAVRSSGARAHTHTRGDTHVDQSEVVLIDGELLRADVFLQSRGIGALKDTKQGRRWGACTHNLIRQGSLKTHQGAQTDWCSPLRHLIDSKMFFGGLRWQREQNYWPITC